MIPGVSRSGATIVGALLLGTEKRAAAEFSFFLAMPTMAGAFAFDLYKNWNILDTQDAVQIGVGFVAAFIAAVIVVRYALAFIGQHGLTPFGWWRILVGVAGLAALGRWADDLLEVRQLMQCRPAAETVVSPRHRSSIGTVCGRVHAACEVSGTVRMRFSAVASEADRSPLDGRGLTHEPRDAGQRLEMIAAGVIGREQQEDEIHRLAVLALEIDRLGQAGEEGDDARQGLELDVRDGNAAAEPRRAEPLTLQERVDRSPGRRARSCPPHARQVPAAPASCSWPPATE